MPSTPKKFQKKNATCNLYSSAESEYPGIGYPSCSRALARVSRQGYDTNHYYQDLGLDPWASEAEIKSALRRMFRRYHPDGTDPDESKFLRYKEIAEVLTNPELRKRYDDTQPGQVFIDSEIKQILIDHGVPMDSISLLDTPEEREIFYDFYSFGVDPFDLLKSQEWYDHLVAVAPIFGYTSSIRVLLHDGEPDWLPRGKILLVPRTWSPNSRNAFALFSVKVR